MLPADYCLYVNRRRFFSLPRRTFLLTQLFSKIHSLFDFFKENLNRFRFQGYYPFYSSTAIVF